MAKACISWFKLLRVPNLFTAPGDALGGLFLAALFLGQTPSPQTALLVSLASMLAYAFGILLNDLCDLREDRKQRPERPLPSGQISPAAACCAALLTAGASLACCYLVQALIPGIALLLSILAYDAGLKRFCHVGSLSMGLCRGINFWLGVACLQPSNSLVPILLLPALAVTLAIAAITLLADGETTIQRPGRIVFFPGLLFLLGWLSVAPFLPYPQVLTTGAWSVSFLLLLYAAGQNLMTGLCLYDRKVPPQIMQPAIGQFIRTLVPWQACWILLQGSPMAWTTTAIVLLAYLASRQLAKKFPQS